MKRIGLVCMVLFGMIGVLFAETKEYNFGVRLNPLFTILALANGGFGVDGGVEFKLAPKNTIGVDGSFYNYSVSVLGTTYSASAFAVSGTYRYYFKKTLSGGYVGGGADFASASVSAGSTSVSVGGFGVHATAGWKFVLGDVFFIDPAISYALIFASSSGSVSGYSASVGGFGWGIGIGFVF